MGEKIMYALLRGWVMLHAYLPMRCLYFLSDLLCTGVSGGTLPGEGDEAQHGGLFSGADGERT